MKPHSETGGTRMKRAAALGLTLAVALTIGACGEGDTTTVIEQSTPEPQTNTVTTKTTTVTEEANTGGGGGGSEQAPEPEAEPSSAPDVVGERLDIAKDTLQEAGYQARVSGGGIFGVVVDQNWVVCSQQPPDGDRVDVNVDRSC
jgi:PASTA domain